MAQDDTRLITARMRLPDGKEYDARLDLNPVLGREDARAVKIRCKKGERSWVAELYIDHDEALQLASEICDILGRTDTRIRDAVAQSEQLATLPTKDRSAVVRMTEWAVRKLRERTGAARDASAPGRTNGAALDFLARHPRLFQCVKHIHEHNKEGAVSRYMSPGYASALLYLMGSSSSDGDKYRNTDPRSEKMLDWERWDRACGFWVDLAAGQLEAVTTARRPGSAGEHAGFYFTEGEGKGSLEERTAVLCKAWTHYLAGDTLTPDDVALQYQMDGEGNACLAECPTVGGIDLGDPKEEEAVDGPAEGVAQAPPPPRSERVVFE